MIRRILDLVHLMCCRLRCMLQARVQRRLSMRARSACRFSVQCLESLQPARQCLHHFIIVATNIAEPFMSPRALWQALAAAKPLFTSPFIARLILTLPFATIQCKHNALRAPGVSASSPFIASWLPARPHQKGGGRPATGM